MSPGCPLRQARDLALHVGQRPALGETIAQVGKSAMLLTPILKVNPNLAVFLFIAAAFKPVFAQPQDESGRCWDCWVWSS